MFHLNLTLKNGTDYYFDGYETEQKARDAAGDLMAGIWVNDNGGAPTSFAPGAILFARVSCSEDS